MKAYQVLGLVLFDQLIRIPDRSKEVFNLMLRAYALSGMDSAKDSKFEAIEKLIADAERDKANDERDHRFHQDGET